MTLLRHHSLLILRVVLSLFLVLTTTTFALTPTQRFHHDLQRVLRPFDDVCLVRKPPTLKGDPDGVERSLERVQHMESLGVANDETYAMVLSALLRRGRRRWTTATSTENGSHAVRLMCVADQAEDLYHRIEAPTFEHTLMLLEAYATCASPKQDYAQRAERLLPSMGVVTPANYSNATQLLATAHVLHAYAWQQANRQPGDCARKAQSYLDDLLLAMKSLDDGTEASSRVSLDEYTLSCCYSHVLEAWSKALGGAEHCQRLLDSLPHPPTADDATNAVLAWTKASKPQQGQLILDRYNTTALAGHALVAAWGQAGRPDMAHALLRHHVADLQAYNGVLQAYARKVSEGDASAMDTILQLVEEMEHHEELAPNALTYETLLHCQLHVGQPDEAERALYLWERCRKRLPHNRFHNKVIDAYAKQGIVATHLHERMLRSMDCRPDVITTTTLLEAWAKSSDPDAPTKAMELWTNAMKDYQSSQDPLLRPNLRTFTMAIQALAKHHGSVVQARGLLDQLLEMYGETNDPLLQPNAYPYNYVLNCAANSLADKEEAFRIATRTYQELRQHERLKPDSFTYAFWLKCCNNLLTPGEIRTKCIAYAFEECKHSGLLTKEVLTRLFQAGAPGLVYELLETTAEALPSYRTVRIHDLPRSWSSKTTKSRR